MTRRIASALILLTFAQSTAVAGEQTITLAVKGMTCASCPYQVEAALKHVDGVKAIEVSLERGQAIVTFDDGRTTVALLTKATAEAGFPSSPVGETR
ncbi:MAG: mercury resistance system periplasmic binding protein MerP [Alphaproteobacteria bacterium]|nr:MAG: mercury resistance system periplasmic binding protein MerP [Alphaproteobacteria bacterium]